MSKKRGRPRKHVWGEIIRELTAEDIRLREATRNKGGRPEHSLNRELREGTAARPAGQSQQAFVREWFERQNGYAPTLDEVIKIERRIRRRRI